MKKSFISLIVVILILSVSTIIYTKNRIDSIKVEKLDVIAVNDVVQTISENWENIKLTHSYDFDKHGLDFVLLDVNNKAILKTNDNLSEDLTDSLANFNSVIDVYDKENNYSQVGTLVIKNNYSNDLNVYKKQMYTTCLVVVLVVLFLCIGLIVYIYIRVYRPFSRLESFAKNVASGNLDIPFEMDKKNVFGAFTESFDIMREEIKLARKAENQANKSKKELVAQLSHDIKTPVASIKALSELLEAKSISENDSYHLSVIQSKADQINTLITNMFSATLEELQELKVEISEHSSRLIFEIIKKSDYLNKVKEVEIKECLVYIDLIRLTQIIDNIISNSYKYANTNIEVTSFCDEEYLVIEFKDFGSGVKDEELSLLFNKFYRADNSKENSGVGLGLYISSYLMDKMNGKIKCENLSEGFKVKISILLV